MMRIEEKQAYITEAVRKFEASKKDADDYVSFLDVAHTAYNQGSALSPEILREAIRHGFLPIKVVKKNGRNFQSGLKVHTIRGLVEHPKKHRPAYVFKEDNSYELVSDCTIVE